MSEGGFVVALAPCWSCSRVFSFNPHFVPSLRVDGERRPICGACIELANVARRAAGVEPHVIHPEAYVALPEEDL
jgi:hypothetical protein